MSIKTEMNPLQAQAPLVFQAFLYHSLPELIILSTSSVSLLNAQYDARHCRTPFNMWLSGGIDQHIEEADNSPLISSPRAYHSLCYLWFKHSQQCTAGLPARTSLLPQWIMWSLTRVLLWHPIISYCEEHILYTLSYPAYRRLKLHLAMVAVAMKALLIPGCLFRL